MEDKKFPEFMEKLTKKVKGKNNSQDILAITLTTCQWCKKCKRYLNDKNIEYRYIDVDQLSSSDKAKILEFLKENYDTRISYPFVVCDGKFIVGYDPKKYDDMLKAGDE